MGEEQEQLVSSATPVSLTTATETNIASLVLQPGDYDVWGNAGFVIAGSSCTQVAAGINTVSATLPSANKYTNYDNISIATGNPGFCVPGYRVKVATATTTTVYLVGYAVFTGGTVGGFGAIYARRRR